MNSQEQMLNDETLNNSEESWIDIAKRLMDEAQAMLNEYHFYLEENGVPPKDND